MSDSDGWSILLISVIPGVSQNVLVTIVLMFSSLRKSTRSRYIINNPPL